MGVTFVTSLPAVGIMECYAFQALDGSFWHILKKYKLRETTGIFCEIVYNTIIEVHP